MNKQLTTIVLSRYFVQISFILPIIVIPLGFEPKTHSLEGCCSNPTELRNQHFQNANQLTNNAISHFSYLRLQRYIYFLNTPNFFSLFSFFMLKYRKK